LLALLVQKQVLNCSLLCKLLGLPEYKSAQTGKEARKSARCRFTCFTSKKVQILTQKALLLVPMWDSTWGDSLANVFIFTGLVAAWLVGLRCFTGVFSKKKTGIKVPILTQLHRSCSGVAGRVGARFALLYWRYWYKSTNTDAAGAAGARIGSAVFGLSFPLGNSHDPGVLAYADVCWRMLTYADVC
jgi:hypothetical protein